MYSAQLARAKWVTAAGYGWITSGDYGWIISAGDAWYILRRSVTPGHQSAPHFHVRNAAAERARLQAPHRCVPVGQVFAPFELDIRQAPTEVWPTDAPVPEIEPFMVSVLEGPTRDGPLTLEVASRDKNIAIGVQALMATGQLDPAVRLQLRPPSEPLNVDNELCRAMVKQAATAVGRMMQGRAISGIHVFCAAPQSFMTMLGRELRGMPPIYLYEWSGTRYGLACRVPGSGHLARANQKQKVRAR